MATSELIDLDIYGRKDNSGNPIALGHEQSVENAIIFYLTSKKGDYLLDPSRGGFLRTLQFKLLNTTQVNTRGLQTDLNQRFGAFIQVQSATLTPDFENRRWVCDIKYYFLQTGKAKDLTIYTKDASLKNNVIANQNPVAQKELTEVGYSGDNLIEFVEETYEKQKEEYLIHDSLIGGWVWGKYFLINLTQDSPEFGTILNLINNKG